MNEKNYHSITEIVATVYCEQKVVFDRAHGKVTPPAVKAKAKAGELSHLRFETEARRYQGSEDKRCFIATCIYGENAIETQILRAWRDQFLLPRAWGRVLIQMYYQASPHLLSVLENSMSSRRLTKSCLDVFIHYVAPKP
jgi:hypothetical protein